MKISDSRPSQTVSLKNKNSPRASLWQVFRYLSAYILVAHTYIILLQVSINDDNYERFVQSYRQIPRFIVPGELISLYKIFEFSSYFSLAAFWYPTFFMTSGIYTCMVRLYTFANILPVFLTKNFRPLNLPAAQIKERVIAAYPLFIDLAVTVLMLLVVGHFVLSRLLRTDCETSAIEDSQGHHQNQAAHANHNYKMHVGVGQANKQESKQTKTQNKK